MREDVYRLEPDLPAQHVQAHDTAAQVPRPDEVVARAHRGRAGHPVDLDHLVVRQRRTPTLELRAGPDEHRRRQYDRDRLDLPAAPPAAVQVPGAEQVGGCPAPDGGTGGQQLGDVEDPLSR
jgi:hypothetical protein